jgi:hypothetical protein
MLGPRWRATRSLAVRRAGVQLAIRTFESMPEALMWVSAGWAFGPRTGPRGGNHEALRVS